VLQPRVDYRAAGVVCVVEVGDEVFTASAKKVSIYSSVESELLRRGESLFPFCCFGEPRDWEAIGRAMDWFKGEGDRFMTPDEILKLYD
jgi:hypothetical protein